MRKRPLGVNQIAPRHHRRSEGVACVIYCLLSCLQASLTNSANFLSRVEHAGLHRGGRNAEDSAASSIDFS